MNLKAQHLFKTFDLMQMALRNYLNAFLNFLISLLDLIKIIK